MTGDNSAAGYVYNLREERRSCSIGGQTRIFEVILRVKYCTDSTENERKAKGGSQMADPYSRIGHGSVKGQESFIAPVHIMRKAFAAVARGNSACSHYVLTHK